MTLQEYLDQVASVPWKWGIMDCTMMAANWVKHQRGVDPAAAFRGRYATQEEARLLIKEEGGYVPMIRYSMDSAGLEETFTPDDGDVGIIMVDVGEYMNEMPVCGSISAIRCGGLWVARAAFGIRAGNFPHVAAWKV
jgi:hypothetical protein